jgi:ferritin
MNATLSVQYLQYALLGAEGTLFGTHAWFRQQSKEFSRACEMMGQVPQCTGRLC